MRRLLDIKKNENIYQNPEILNKKVEEQPRSKEVIVNKQQTPILNPYSQKQEALINPNNYMRPSNPAQPSNIYNYNYNNNNNNQKPVDRYGNYEKYEQIQKEQLKKEREKEKEVIPSKKYN